MSLQAVASHLASKGRGPDTMLMHVTPGEVAGLQSLAHTHGGSLTVNPDTGLPEAGFLSSILPAVAGIAGSFIGLPPMLTAGLVGGVTGVATGSLQKGLMAGLGAFGGAGMGNALSSMGTTAAAAAPSTAAQIGATAAPAAETAAAFADAAAPFEAGFVGTEALSGAGSGLSAMDKFSGGIGALTKPGGFDQFVAAQGGGMKALSNAGMAAAPMLTGAFSDRTMPEAPEDDSMIRPYDYDPITQRFTPRTPVPSRDFQHFDAGGSVARFMDIDEAVAQIQPGDIAGPGPFGFAPVGMGGTQHSTKSPAQIETELAWSRGGVGPVRYAFNPQAQTFTKLVDPATTPEAKAAAAAAAPPTSASGITGYDAQTYGAAGMADGGIARLLRGPGDGVSDSIPALIDGQEPAALGDGEFVLPARIVSEIGNGSTEAGARKLYAMIDRIQSARAKTTGKGSVARDSGAERFLPA